MRDLWDFDSLICSDSIIAGVDEAGRGPLAGPVVSAAVILNKEIIIENLNDSKKLSPKIRLAVYKEIIKNCIEYQVGIVDNFTIDRINILEATKLSMKTAIEKLDTLPELAIIDGNQYIDISIKQKNIISGDSKSASIAAASVIAKVTRDLMMDEFDKKYPEYGFAQHKGYGTEKHIAAIKKYGPCEIHRRSFEPVKSY
ncbi:MAG TPA: ribonuclease HII [Elusimicrobia bacterium]|nr:MAG: ribonuclease HII [Elusimicrobia bacterium RIFOXYD2_FULL_34_30]HAM39691.1 ribonuclease HII [Elusimicrobiota bacterium]